RLVPRRARLIISFGPPAASPMRMVHRVHRCPPDVRPNAEMPASTGVAQDSILMVQVSHLTHGRHAFAKKLANFAGGHADLGETAFFGHELRRSSRGTHKLAAGPWNKLIVVQRGAFRNGVQRQGVS